MKINILSTGGTPRDDKAEDRSAGGAFIEDAGTAAGGTGGHSADCHCRRCAVSARCAGIAFGSGCTGVTFGTGGADQGTEVGGAELAAGSHHDDGAVAHRRAGNSRHVGRGVEALDAKVDRVGFNAAGVAYIAQIDVVVSGGEVETGPVAEGEVVAAGGLIKCERAVGHVVAAGGVRGKR